MEHTYLRYECADSFGLITSSASSKAPQSNSILAVCNGGIRNGGPNSSQRPSVVLTTAGSVCVGFHLRTTLPSIKIGHREQLSGGVGTGRALNGDQIVCLDVSQQQRQSERNSGGGATKVATGWVDGAVRIFDIKPEELNNTNNGGYGLAQTLLHDYSSTEQEDFVMREPLVLNGHSSSPVRSVTFCPNSGTRLASGGSDGSVVLWDIIAETGLFRLLGHRGGITNIQFANIMRDELNSASPEDFLITSSLDGLVKVWDLKGQCCTQTIPNHKGEVWGAACRAIPTLSSTQRQTKGQDVGDDDIHRVRLLTGSNDGQVRVWSLTPPKRTQVQKDVIVNENESQMDSDHGSAVVNREGVNSMDKDNICSYMGSLTPPPNLATSSERISCIHFHPDCRYVGILHANSKNLDVYNIRSVQESLRKKQRRLRRRKEKSKKTVDEESSSNKNKGQKRGMLDDPESGEDDVEGTMQESELKTIEQSLDPEMIKASDEFEYFGTVRASHKIKGFVFVPAIEKGGGIRVVCVLSTNALETHALTRTKPTQEKQAVVVSNKVSTVNMHGHPTGIRAVELSSDDALCCTVSKNQTKIWSVASRSCIQSLAPAATDGTACYGLCAKFLPGNLHVAIGTREGHLLLVDIAAGEVVYIEENAHDGAIWSLDLRRPTAQQSTPALITGSADKTVKFWDIEAQDVDEDGDGTTPMVVHTRTLQMTDDVVAVRYSHSTDPTKRLVFASTLDSTIKVFFEDTLKFFLSLYGHKLPALAVDASDDDAILASSGADKTVKIWGLDFGDTHRTLHGHEDSVTDLKFVRRTHNFFTTSKDGSVRYWDGDRFEQILLLHGHTAEVNCLALSRTGAFVLSGGMDRQVRVWERTKDIVFLEEERERELERMFDRIDNRDEGGTAKILQKKGQTLEEDEEGDAVLEDEPQSEAAVKRSVLSVSAGDRIMESLERADQELKDSANFRKNNPTQERRPNLLMLGMEPPMYMLWVLKSIRNTELEQSLLVLPLGHVERLLYYLVVLLKSGRGVELCSRVSIFLVKTHQNQLLNNRSLSTPIRELRRLIRIRLAEARDTIGFNLAALKMVDRIANDRKQSFLDFDDQQGKDIWAGLGLGSDAAAALERRGG